MFGYKGEYKEIITRRDVALQDGVRILSATDREMMYAEFDVVCGYGSAHVGVVSLTSFAVSHNCDEFLL